MSKVSSATLVLSLVGLVLAASLFLQGPSGPGALAAVAALLVVAVSLGVVAFLRAKHGPRSGTRRPGSGGSRTVVAFAMAGGALGAVALVVALVVAQGEARGHAFVHLIIGVVLLAQFVTIGAVWRPRAESGPSMGRAMLLTGLWLASAAVLLESIGGSGYDTFNAAPRIGWLTELHGLVAPAAGLGLPLLPLSVAVLAAVLVANRSVRGKDRGVASC